MTSKRKFSFRMLLASAVVFSVLAGPGFMGKAQARVPCTYRTKSCATTPCSIMYSTQCEQITPSIGSDMGCATMKKVNGSCGAKYDYGFLGCTVYLGTCGGYRGSGNCT